MPNYNPDLQWYTKTSEQKGLKQRCPFATAARCPRFYQSLSLLGRAGSTQIDETEDERLKAFWESTDLWPSTAEQCTSVSGPVPGNKAFHNFCPEVAFLRFGLFASDLLPYHDEIDSESAHKKLAVGSSENDYRWHWWHVTEAHYSECPLYSLLPYTPSSTQVVSPAEGTGTIAVVQTDNKTRQHDMQNCFVIQPFDKGKFDKRFDDVFAPAIKAAGLTPYRVDKDPNVDVPIEAIEQGIRDAAVCLVEITLDNPNVWYELGFARALGKPVVMVCSKERPTKFPFDVQHRTIIPYDVDSPSDYHALSTAITARIKALLSRKPSGAPVEAASHSKPSKTGSDLPEATAKVLQFLFDLGDDFSIEVIARQFQFKMSVAEYHFDILAQRKFVIQTRVGMQTYGGSSPAMFALTSTGRAYVMQHNSEGDQPV